MKDKCYEERLQYLKLTTLETRRLRGGELIEVFKIMKGIENVKSHLFVVKALLYNRGNSLKLFKPSCMLDIRTV